MSGFLRRYARECSVLVAYLALLLALLIFQPRFFQRQFLDTCVTAAPALVLAVGMTLVIVSRQIDISVGAQFSVCAVVVALAARAGIPVPLAAIIAIACGAAFGALNGLFVAALRLPSIIVTLALMVILNGGLSLARHGEAVRDLPDGFQWLGLSQGTGQIVLLGVALAVFGVAALTTNFVAAGRAPYAVGSDAETARLAGVRPVRVVFWVFVLTGALAGLAATLEAVRQPQVATNLGKDLELKVIAAVVVGGAAITGGRGTLIGTLLGVLLLATVRPALNFLGASDEWEKAAQGAIILLAVVSEAAFNRSRSTRHTALVSGRPATPTPA